MLTRKRGMVARILELQSSLLPQRSGATHWLSLLRKAGLFASIGAVNALIDFVVFWQAVRTFDIPKVPANVLAWTVAVLASYLMNTYITFAQESGRRIHWRSCGVFVTSGAIGMVGNTTTMVFADWLLASMFVDADLRLAIAKSLAIGASFMINFSVSCLFVFRQWPV